MGKKLFFDGAFYFEMHIAPVYLNCNEHKTYIYMYVYIYGQSLEYPFWAVLAVAALQNFTSQLA